MARTKDILMGLLNPFIVIGLFCFFNSSFLKASTYEEMYFDSIYFHTAVTVGANDVDRAIEIADSLFINSKSKRNQVKALMLSSSLFQQKGDLANSIRIAKKAYVLAKKNKNYDWQARISGFLSSQYRIMEMYKEGERYLDEGIEISKKVDNEQMSFLYQGLILQEKTYYLLAHKESDQAFKTALNASEFFQKIESERDRAYFIASNYELIGRVCNQNQDWKLAESYFLKALQGMRQVSNQDLMIEGQVFSGLGNAYFQQVKLDSAIKYLEKAEVLLVHSKNLPLEIEVFKTLSEYYHVIQDYDNYVFYNERYIESFKESERKKKESINLYVESTKLKESETRENRNVFIGLSILLSILILGIVVFYKIKHKKEKVLFQNVMKELLYAKENFSLESSEMTPETLGNDESKALMSGETEENILEKLRVFEKGTKFLDKNISLSKLAGIIETNNKYLSHVLNAHKRLNFSSYINTLRIKYIVNVLNDNEQYRRYKISYLAEETGYSSHTKFSLAFKSVTGLAPSVFLKELDKTSA